MEQSSSKQSFKTRPTSRPPKKPEFAQKPLFKPFADLHLNLKKALPAFCVHHARIVLPCQNLQGAAFGGISFLIGITCGVARL
jgi:hypothetical protein